MQTFILLYYKLCQFFYINVTLEKLKNNIVLLKLNISYTKYC